MRKEQFSIKLIENNLHRSNGNVHVQIVEDDLFVGVIWSSIVFIATPDFNRGHSELLPHALVTLNLKITNE